MIHYALQCRNAHAFDGWFPSSAAFDAQAAKGLLECPVCGDSQVERGLMAPSVPKKGNAVVAAAPQKMALAEDRLPDQVRAALQKLRAEVEANCDHVGSDFAEEARRIHYGESHKRGIYGEATPDQAEALADEGIEIARIPWVPRADG